MDTLSLFDVEVDQAPGEAAPRPVPAARSRPATPGRRDRLLAVDGNALAHRAFHAYGTGDLAGAAPRQRGALHGFFALLAAISDRTSPDAVVVGFDCRMRSHRRERFPVYKANRPDKDPALYALVDLVRAVLDDCGVTVCTPGGWEADDVLASAATAATAAGWDCVAATSDRDAFALVDERTAVLRLRSGMHNAELVDPAWIRRRLKIAPSQYTEFAALRGDPSDNLAGIAGIGASRAAALLALYPSVEEAVADPIGCRSVLGSQVGQTLIDDLAADASVFRRNVDVMTLRRDLPVDVPGARRTTAPHRIQDACLEWGLAPLAGRLAVALGARPVTSAPLPTEPPER